MTGKKKENYKSIRSEMKKLLKWNIIGIKRFKRNYYKQVTRTNQKTLTEQMNSWVEKPTDTKLRR